MAGHFHLSFFPHISITLAVTTGECLNSKNDLCSCVNIPVCKEITNDMLQYYNWLVSLWEAIQGSPNPLAEVCLFHEHSSRPQSTCYNRT